jgi:hypothetical protein
VLITTPTKRLRKKKLPTMVKKMKKKIQNQFKSYLELGTMPKSLAVAHLNISSDHPAPVDITKRVIKAYAALSKVK